MDMNLSATFFFQIYSQVLITLLGLLDDQVSWLVWDFLSFNSGNPSLRCKKVFAMDAEVHNVS